MRHVQSATFVHRLECLCAALNIETNRINGRVAPVHGKCYRCLIANIGMDRLDVTGWPRRFRNIGVARTANGNAHCNALCNQTFDNRPA